MVRVERGGRPRRLVGPYGPDSSGRVGCPVPVGQDVLFRQLCFGTSGNLDYGVWTVPHPHRLWDLPPSVGLSPNEDRKVLLVESGVRHVRFVPLLG